jgi:UV excision repair protein RAD23
LQCFERFANGGEGKILQDDKTVEAYKIEEKGFIVCMVAKVRALKHPQLKDLYLTLSQPKAAPAAAASSSKTPSTPAPAVASTPAPPPAPSQSSTSATAAPATPSPAGAGAAAPAETPATFNDPSALTIVAQRAEAVANLEGMGFERSQIDLAMRAAFFNPDRAVEYLLNVCFPEPKLLLC